MKKLIMATAVALTMGVASANVQLDGLTTKLQGMYTGLGAVVTNDVLVNYTGATQVFGTNGLIADVTTGANTFVDAFLNVSGDVSFDIDSWTLSNAIGDTSSLVAARTSLRASETALMAKVKSDLIGTGAIANTANVADIGIAIANGGLLGVLTASIQTEAAAFTGQVNTTDVQALYEQDGALESFLSITGLASSNLQDRVNNTRSAVASVRDGFAVSTENLSGGNDGKIVVANGNKSFTASVLTNNANDHIQLSDYFTSSSYVGSESNTYGQDLGGNGITDVVYSSFTDFVLGKDKTVLTNTVVWGADSGVSTIDVPVGWTLYAKGDTSILFNKPTYLAGSSFAQFSKSGNAFKYSGTGVTTYTTLELAVQAAILELY